jgi:hypothetical protein
VGWIETGDRASGIVVEESWQRDGKPHRADGGFGGDLTDLEARLDGLTATVGLPKAAA